MLSKIQFYTAGLRELYGVDFLRHSEWNDRTFKWKSLFLDLNKSISDLAYVSIGNLDWSMHCWKQNVREKEIGREKKGRERERER